MEISKHEIIAKAMQDLGVDLSTFESEFPTRFRFQKYIYILQLVTRNFHVGNFSLYLRGPYSSDVAQTGYEIAKNFTDLNASAQKWGFNKVAARLLENIKELFKSSPAGLKEEEKLEAWTTYKHLKAWYSGDEAKESALKELFSRKGQFKAKEEAVKAFVKRADEVLG